MNKEISRLLKGYDLSEEETLQCLKDKTEESKCKVVMANLKLVAYIANKRAFFPYQVEDYFFAGVHGLIKAVDKADAGYDIHGFRSFMGNIVSQHITRCSIKTYSVASIGESAIVKLNKYKRALVDLEFKFGREPTDEECCEYLDVSMVTIGNRKSSILSSVTLDSDINGNGSFSRLLMDSNTDIPCDNMNKEDLRNFLKEAISRLNDSKREIICQKFFEGKTNKEIGVSLGKTTQRIQQISIQILRDLRFDFKNHNVGIEDLGIRDDSFFGKIL
jgi:RNA polymerase sigma factor (sigma-70 family)